MSKELVPTSTTQSPQRPMASTPLPPAPAPTPQNPQVRPLNQR